VQKKITGGWHIAQRVRHSRVIDSCDEKPSTRGETCLEPVCLARLSKGRAVDRLVVSRGVVQESPAITGEDSEQESTKTPSARKPHYQPERKSSRPVETLSWRGPTVQQVPERRSSKTLRGRGHDTSNTAANKIRSRAEDIGSDISGHRRQPCPDRRGELIEERRNVTYVMK